MWCSKFFQLLGLRAGWFVFFQLPFFFLSSLISFPWISMKFIFIFFPVNFHTFSRNIAAQEDDANNKEADEEDDVEEKGRWLLWRVWSWRMMILSHFALFVSYSSFSSRVIFSFFSASSVVSIHVSLRVLCSLLWVWVLGFCFVHVYFNGLIRVLNYDVIFLGDSLILSDEVWVMVSHCV